MKTERNCHELLTIFAKTVDAMFLGVCAVIFLWFLNRKKGNNSFSALKFKKVQSTERKEIEFGEQTNIWSKSSRSENKLECLRPHLKPERPKIETLSQFTQTDFDIKWKAVWVGDDSLNDVIENHHRTELVIDLKTGEATRKEGVFRQQCTHIIAPLK